MFLLYLSRTVFGCVSSIQQTCRQSLFTSAQHLCTQQSRLPVLTTQGAVFAFSFGLFVWLLTISLQDRGALSKVVLFGLSDCITNLEKVPNKGLTLPFGSASNWPWFRLKVIPNLTSRCHPDAQTNPFYKLSFRLLTVHLSFKHTHTHRFGRSLISNKVGPM